MNAANPDFELISKAAIAPMGAVSAPSRRSLRILLVACALPAHTGDARARTSARTRLTAPVIDLRPRHDPRP
jgi:hypothetical protein